MKTNERVEGRCWKRGGKQKREGEKEGVGRKTRGADKRGAVALEMSEARVEPILTR